MTAAFDAFVARYHDHFTQDPNSCVELGVEARLGDLPDPSLAAADAHVARGRELIEEADSIDASALDFDTKLDLELARLWLERDIHQHTFEFNGKTTLPQMPSAGDDVGDGMFLMFVNDPRPDAERLLNITERLEKVPAYLEALVERLDVPVTRWVAVDLEKVEGLASLFDTFQGWAEECEFAELDRFISARRAAEQALSGYASTLRAMPTQDHFHAGVETARRIVELNGIDLSLDELHGIAKHFLASTNDQIETLRAKLAAKYELPPSTDTVGVQTFLNEKYKIDIGDGPVERVLDAYNRSRQEILAFIEQRQLFPIFENQDMKILRTPTFMAPSIPAGAMMAPPPFREGVHTSLVYLTLSKELMDEHTALSIPVMMIHEGIPGHHLQLATAAINKSVVRRHMWNAVHGEGWTTMLEDYMLDLGFMGELTDESRFIGKRDLARIGARVAIDLYFMTGEKRFLDVGIECDLSSDDPFVAAGNLLKAVTGFTDGRVQAELNWYSSERGYPLCYLTGNHLVWKLKKELERAQAGKLEELALDREFHRVFLEAGNMPLPFLRRVLEHEGLLPA